MAARGRRSDFMRRVLMQGVSIALAGALAGGCAEEAALPIATVRDSAGIAIVENRWAPEEVSAGWGVAAEPRLDIGVMEGDEALQLFNVSGGVLLSDGRIAVVNGGTQEVRVFRPDGTPDTVFGGEGDGPGEFRNPSLVGSRGDTLVLYDLTLRRATLWHPSAGIVREFAVGGEGGGFPVPQGLFADGGIAFGGGMSFSSQTGFPSGRVRPSSSFLAVTPEGRPAATFGEYPGAEMFARVSDAGFTARSIPFARVTTSVAGDSMLWVGTQDAWEILGFVSTGALRRIVRVDRPSVPVTEALRDRYIAEALADAEDEAERRRLRQTFQEMPFGETVAPYGALRLDALGDLWVADGTVPGAAETGWSIFDPAGRMIGRVVLPANVRLLDIESDRILAVARDDLEIEHVRVLGLERPSAPAR